MNISYYVVVLVFQMISLSENMKLALDEIESLIRAHEDFHKNKTVFYDSLGRKMSFAGKNKQPIERFCQKILINSENDCWEWIGAKSIIGYGQFAPTSRRQGGVLTSPHRFVWAYLNGEIPFGQEVDHQCRNRICTNPKHLRLVSHQENQQSLKKDFCKHGHPYSGDNLHINSQGKRICKKCRSIRTNLSLKNRMENDADFRKKRLEYLNSRAKQKRLSNK